MATSVPEAILTLGKSVKAKLASPAIERQPKEQLRAPLEHVFDDFSTLCATGSSELSESYQTATAASQIEAF